MKFKRFDESKKLNESFPLKSVIDWDHVAYSINKELGDDFLINIHEDQTSRMMGGKISVLFSLIEVGNFKNHYRGFFTTSGDNETITVSMNGGSLTGTNLGDATSPEEIATKLIDFVKLQEGYNKMKVKNLSNNRKMSESVDIFSAKSSGVLSLSPEVNKKLRTVIKDWYIAEFPNDELGAELLDDFTFEDLFNDLTHNVFDYECCADDSLVRERVFEELSNILGVDYDVIYRKWIDTGRKQRIQERLVRKLKETWSRPWDGLKGQEKLDAIKKFCAENPSLDPARVLCSNDGLARVEEEPIIIGDYKFVQDGRAWDVYRNDKFLYTGTRFAICKQISDLWEKDLYKTETFKKVNEAVQLNDDSPFKSIIGNLLIYMYDKIDKDLGIQIDKVSYNRSGNPVANFTLTAERGDNYKEFKGYLIFFEGSQSFEVYMIPETSKFGFGTRIGTAHNAEEVANILVDFLKNKLQVGITLPDDIQEDIDVRSGTEKRVARDIANETEIPEDFVYQCFDSWKKFGFNLKSGEPVDTEELKWLVVSEYNRA